MWWVQARGDDTDCVVGKLLGRVTGEREGRSAAEEEEIIKNVAAVALEGTFSLDLIFPNGSPLC